MRPWLRYTLLLVVFYLLFMVARLPATLAIGVLQQRVPFNIAGGSGTVWRGEASALQLGRLHLDQISWQLAWSRLWRGELAMHVMAAHGHERLDLIAGRQLGGGLFVRDQALPLPPLDQLLFDPPWGVSGTAAVDLHGIRFDNSHLAAIEGKVQVHTLGLAAPANLVLGDYQAEFTTTAQGINIAIQDTRAALGVTGAIQARPDGSYVMNMKFQARDPGNRELMQILQLLGSGGAPQATMSRSGVWPY